MASIYCYPIYNELQNNLNGKWPGMQFIVDQWPEPKAVVEIVDSKAKEKTQCEAFLRLIVALYAEEEQALSDLLQDPEVVDWSTPKIIPLIDKRVLDTVLKVCSQHGQTSVVSAYLLMAKPDALPPLPVPDGMRLLPVNNEMTTIVDRTWKYHGQESGDLVTAYVKNFSSLALVTDTGCHVGHMVGDSHNCMAMLYIHPEFRRKEYAKVIISNLAQTFFQVCANAYVLIDPSNVASLQLHTSIGFQIVPDCVFQIVFYHPRKCISC